MEAAGRRMVTKRKSCLWRSGITFLAWTAGFQPGPAIGRAERDCGTRPKGDGRGYVPISTVMASSNLAHCPLFGEQIHVVVASNRPTAVIRLFLLAAVWTTAVLEDLPDNLRELLGLCCRSIAKPSRSGIWHL